MSRFIIILFLWYTGLFISPWNILKIRNKQTIIIIIIIIIIVLVPWSDVTTGTDVATMFIVVKSRYFTYNI